jgi:calcium permeable stress-gated cation channel
MNKSDGEIARKKLMGVLWLVVVCFFNTVPLFIISVLANLEGIRTWPGFSFLDSWFKESPGSFTFVSGVLPATISGIFGFFLPIIMRHLAKVRFCAFVRR